MTKIRVTGWETGFNPVQFNRYIQQKCNLRLSDAKAVVDRILSKDVVLLEFQEFTENEESKLSEFGLIRA